MDTEEKKFMPPKWERDFDIYLPIYNTFIIQGYINDLQPLPKSYMDNSLSVIATTDYFHEVYSTLKRIEYNFDGDTREYCVIGYDPMRAQGHRFNFFDKDETPQDAAAAEPNAQASQAGASRANEDDKPENPYGNDQPEKSAFFSLLYDENLEKQMPAGHSAGGISLDMARIHFALSGQLGKFKKPFMFVLSVSRFSTSPGNVGNDDENMTFSVLSWLTNALDTVKRGRKSQSKLVLLADKTNDIPAWVENEQYNHTIKKIYVAKPGRDDRLFYTQKSFLPAFSRRDNKFDGFDKEKQGKITDALVNRTDGFSMRELEHLKLYACSKDNKFDIENCGASIASFKSGVSDNPWEDDKIAERVSKLKEFCSKTIIGQDRILDEARKIMALAVTEINRTFTPNAPRAVLFLAGPTGTGKTELAKQLTELVFGNPDRMKRFDMSEFKADHSDARLFGAPPGYVGFEAGGELTEYVKNYPFSLILFDEIEKASGSIMDKFLQILSDGRLTDGQGATVDFSNTIIIMTSNAGIRDPRKGTVADIMNTDADSKLVSITIDEMRAAEETYLETVEDNDYLNLPFEYNKSTNPNGVRYDILDAAIKEKLNANLEKYFSTILGRPELYGRLKESIICYNYISAEAARSIALKYIDEVNRDVLKRKNVKIDMVKRAEKMGEKQEFDEVKNYIVKRCISPKVREMGARGVIDHVKMYYAGDISEYILEHRATVKTAMKTMRAKLENDKIIWGE